MRETIQRKHASMLRPMKKSASSRNLSRSSSFTSESSGSTGMMPSFLKSKSDSAASWLPFAGDGMHPNLGMHQAAATGNVGLVKFAMDHGQPHSSMLNGLFPLHAACCGGDEATVRLLLSYGAHINAVRETPPGKANASTSGSEGSTPLHFAAANGHIHIVRLLLENGAHPSVKDKAGLTPELLASMHQHSACTSFLRHWNVTEWHKDATRSSNASDVQSSKLPRSCGSLDLPSRGHKVHQDSTGAPLRSQRSFESFSSAAANVKASFRSTKRSLRKISTANHLVGAPVLSPARSKVLPSRSFAPKTPMASMRHKSRAGTSLSLMKGSPTAPIFVQSAHHEQKRRPSLPPYLEREANQNTLPPNHGTAPIVNALLGPSTHRVNMNDSDDHKRNLSIESRRTVELGHHAPSQGERILSASFLPSLESSSDSTYTDGGLDHSRFTEANSERSTSNGGLHFFNETREAHDFGENSNNIFHNSTMSASRVNTSSQDIFAAVSIQSFSTAPSPSPNPPNIFDEVQELLEGSADAALPSGTKRRAYSASSSTSKSDIPHALYITEAMDHHTHNFSAGLPLQSASDREQLKDRQAESLLTPASSSALPQARSHDMTCKASRKVSSHYKSPTPISARKERRELEGTSPNKGPARSYSVASYSIKSETSSLNSGFSSILRGRSTKQAHQMIQTAEIELEAMSQNASHASLTDVLAAYGEALSLQKRVPVSLTNIAPLTRKSSTLSLGRDIPPSLEKIDKSSQRNDEDCNSEFCICGSLPPRVQYFEPVSAKGPVVAFGTMKYDEASNSLLETNKSNEAMADFSKPFPFLFVQFECSSLLTAPHLPVIRFQIIRAVFERF